MPSNHFAIQQQKHNKKPLNKARLFGNQDQRSRSQPDLKTLINVYMCIKFEGDTWWCLGIKANVKMFTYKRTDKRRTNGQVDGQTNGRADGQ